MGVTAGLGRGDYLLLFPELIAWRARKPRHYADNTRFEIAITTDPLSVVDRLGRREREALSRSYEWAPKFKNHKGQLTCSQLT